MNAPLALELAAVRRRVLVLRPSGLRRRELLQGIDLELARGRTLGLIGPNGSGKTSLLRLIAGIDRPSAGVLRVLGGSPERSSVRARIGFLPESSPFPGELSARSALHLLGSLQGMPRRRLHARTEELLERVGLRELAQLALKHYSRGMKRRFGLAQAWLHEPELVLLDEPTAGLDAQGFAVLDRFLAETAARGASVVLSSHLLTDLHARCTDLALLLEGRLAAHGTPQAMLSVPGRWRVELDGLEQASLAALRGWIEERGGRVLELAPGGRTLLEVYATGSAAS